MGGRRGGDIWKGRRPVRFFIVPEQPGTRKANTKEVSQAAQRGKKQATNAAT